MNQDTIEDQDEITFMRSPESILADQIRSLREAIEDLSDRLPEADEFDDDEHAPEDTEYFC